MSRRAVVVEKLTETVSIDHELGTDLKSTIPFDLAVGVLHVTTIEPDWVDSRIACLTLSVIVKI
jgi:hypothetical protein